MKKVSMILLSLTLCLFLSTSAFADSYSDAAAVATGTGIGYGGGGGSAGASATGGSSGATATGIGGAVTQTVAPNQNQGQTSTMTNTVSPTQSQGLTNTNSPTTTAGSTSQLSLTQNTNIPAGQGRLFAWPVAPGFAGLTNYFGPFNTGWNVLDPELVKYLPGVLSMKSAQRMAVKGVKVELRTLEELNYEFDTCRLYTAVPPAHRLIGYAFVEGKKSSTTIDADAAVRIAAMQAGANAVILIKVKAGFQANSSGWGIGLSHVTSSLGGTEKDQANTSAGGLGYSSATAKSSSVDGLIYVLIQDEKGMAASLKTEAPIAMPKPVTKAIGPIITKAPLVKAASAPKVEDVVAKPKTKEIEVSNLFRCVSTSSYTAPVDCK